MAFHDRLKDARKAKGFTQSDLGELVGVKKATISGYEIGKSEPSMAIIQSLMRILEVDANFLWQDEMAHKGIVASTSILTGPEYDHIEKYRLLNDEGQRRVDDYTEDLVNGGRYKKGMPKASNNAVKTEISAELTDVIKDTIQDALFEMDAEKRERPVSHDLKDA